MFTVGAIAHSGLEDAGRIPLDVFGRVAMVIAHSACLLFPQYIFVLDKNKSFKKYIYLDILINLYVQV